MLNILLDGVLVVTVVVARRAGHRVVLSLSVDRAARLAEGYKQIHHEHVFALLFLWGENRVRIVR